MKEVILKIVIRNEFEINLSIAEIRRYPMYNQLHYEYDERIIIIEYLPGKGVDEKEYIDLIKRKIKRQYRAVSIEILHRDAKEISTKQKPK